MSKMSPGAGADEPATEIFTAVSILNREGHAPGAADRSVQPQHRRDADPGGEPDRRGVTRSGAIAGGAVLAGGAAVGVAVFADSEPTVGEMVPVGDGGDGGAYPGQGLLDAEVPAEAPLEPVAIDPAASTGSLDETAPGGSPGAPAGAPAHPAAGGAGAASASPDSGGPDAGRGGSGGADGGDETAFGSGSGHDTSDGDTSDGDTSDGDTSDGDTAGGDEGGLLGAGGDEGVLDTGLLASDSDSSGDEAESSGDSSGEDDGGGGLLGTGLLA
ncbi:hypothetical protein [Pseudonocardia sp. DLS-67]